MIYLEETLNLVPASPETLDVFIEFAQEKHVPLCQRLGARLVAAWFGNVEWICPVTQVTEFDDMEALKAFRIRSCEDRAWGEYQARLEALAPERRSRLLEPLGPIPIESLHEAVSQSQQSPVGGYNLAILEVGADKMAQFKVALAERASSLPK